MNFKHLVALANAMCGDSDMCYTCPYRITCDELYPKMLSGSLEEDVMFTAKQKIKQIIGDSDAEEIHN